ncbi:lipase secretion chaperone [Burkholderia alba]|uniref:lipase secretion chaperone n=1 Tax=Burkholderia alba TaxID=2683677 RepID=UPI002B053AB0|nr:lipase secretion chaperone [Burkholderia alba]
MSAKSVMTTRPVRPARRAGRRAVMWAGASLAAAVLIGFAMRPRAAADAPIAPAASAASPGDAASAFGASASASGPAAAWPAALQGTSAPRLPVDARGGLLHVRDVRDFFDYFLTARGQLTPAQLDALVRQQIAAQLGGKPAAAEGVALWQRYQGYLAALTQLASAAPAAAATANPGAAIAPADVQQARTFIAQRAVLRRQQLADWSTPFFGDEDQALEVYLGRMAIAQDKTLSDAERTRRLAELDRAMPPAQRAAEQAQKQQAQWLAESDRLEKQDLSPAALRDEVARLKGPEFAERFVAQRQADQAWQSTYDQYAAQRGQIEAQHLASQDQQAQIDQLRARFFPKQSDALRAAGLDGIARGGR